MEDQVWGSLGLLVSNRLTMRLELKVRNCAGLAAESALWLRYLEFMYTLRWTLGSVKRRPSHLACYAADWPVLLMERWHDVWLPLV